MSRTQPTVVNLNAEFGIRDTDGIPHVRPDCIRKFAFAASCYFLSSRNGDDPKYCNKESDKKYVVI